MSHALMQFFNYAHLPPGLRTVSEQFYSLAKKMDDTLPLNAEKTTALRKLLEAKDCAVRAMLYQDPTGPGD
jgi:hypothetical protein